MLQLRGRMHDLCGPRAPEAGLSRADGLVAAAISVATLVQTAWFLRAMHRFTGAPGGVLDDAYIHFQFATQLARGHFFEWTPGGGYSTGATSMLWPVLLAPAYWLGLREGRMALWAAALGAIALWVSAWGAYRILSEALGSRRWGGVGAALVTTSGAFLWGCFGGMEVPLVAAMVVGVVRARQSSRRRTALVLAALLPLARPDWMPVTLLVAGLYALEERRLWPLTALAPATAGMALNLALTGHVATNAALSRLLAFDPNLTWPGVARTWSRQAVELFRDHLGRSRLLPFGAPVLAAIGAIRPSRAVRLAALSALIGLLATVTVADPFRQSNRYQLPALPALLIAAVAGVATLVSVLPSTRVRAAVAAGFAVVLIGSQVSSLARHNDAFAHGCRDIRLQQVEMGRWMRAHLPPGTRIALNDAGAIPLFSQLPALDLIGVATPGFPAEWREGEGAVYEALERLPTDHRPQYFVIYPRWVNLPDLLGPVVHTVSIADNRTCGEAEKVLFQARWDVAHSGDQPLLAHAGTIVDEVDVADLESERAHEYATDRPSRTIYRRERCQGSWVSEGGRVMHVFERMRVTLAPGREAHLVWRTDAWQPARVRVLVDGRVAARTALSEVRAFVEPEVTLPATLMTRARPEIRVELEEPGEMSTFHYWVLQ
jgi:hypothetical protein